MVQPIIIGGNGHSGTRVFAQLLERGGVFVGVPRLTRARRSYDLSVQDLLDRWVSPHVFGDLAQEQWHKMEWEFRRRLRWYFPLRVMPWGFKNPRTMFLLPLWERLFPGMRFVHVIRDGRDIALGNRFATRNKYARAFLHPDEEELSPEERMILFWGRSNESTAEYGRRHLGEAYMAVRLEDLCDQPRRVTADLFDFAGCKSKRLEAAHAVVRKPASIGRWRTYEENVIERVTERGRRYLEAFGYLARE
jgi:hypothetical protein